MEKERQSSIKENTTTTKTIYVVDDNEMNREILPLLLVHYAKQMNYCCTVRSFENGEAAIETMIANTHVQVHLLIIDQNMGSKNMLGTQLIQAITISEQIREKPKMVLLSGDTGNDAIDTLRNSQNPHVKAILDRAGNKEQTLKLLSFAFDEEIKEELLN